MYICVDFDGTIVDHAYPEIGKPVPHAIEVLTSDLFRENVKIILFTMRNDGYHQFSTQGSLAARSVLTEAVDYLNSNGVCLYGVNNNPDQDWSNSRKVYADAYIDDAAVGCPLIELPGFNRPCVDWEIVSMHIYADIGISKRSNMSKDSQRG